MIKIGEKINNRFRLVSRIAQGGMAEVYEAIDLQTKKSCAVKFILESLVKDPQNVIRFAREAKIAKRLVHPNIAKIYESGNYEGRPYIVFELIKGQTLGEKLKLSSKITYIEACEIMLQMCDVLNYIHLRGIIHRDIKPDNIYYLFDGSIKLSDFGIALDLTNKTKEDAALVGSVHYLAPEVCEGASVTKLADIYSLGITFYELVTKRLPYSNNNPLDVAVSQVRDNIPYPSEFAPDLPKPIENVILKATMKNPSERYQSAKEMREDLLNILSNKKKYEKHRSFFQKLFGFRED
ncbi:MAG: serine/threonine protein kinase [Bacilli bacterium]|nr:serine/threonine protein kinase [Bacilli bacterium]